jgi:nucleotide-binding universal stress UspA family protein
MRYLVALDGWEASRRALAFAIEQATLEDAPVDVAYVVGEDGGDPDSVDQIHDIVDEVTGEVDPGGDVPVEVVVLEVNKRRKPATRVGVRLLEFIDENDHDAVYIGNERTGTAERMIVGSVSATLIEDRSVPIVLVS